MKDLDIMEPHLKKTTNFTVAAAYNPNVRDISKTKRLVEKKIKSGAD